MDTPNIDAIGPACDNIADWTNDMKNRCESIKNDGSLSLGDIADLLDSNIVDGGRIAEQVQIIRDAITVEPHDG